MLFFLSWKVKIYFSLLNQLKVRFIILSENLRFFQKSNVPKIQTFNVEFSGSRFLKFRHNFFLRHLESFKKTSIIFKLHFTVKSLSNFRKFKLFHSFIMMVFSISFVHVYQFCWRDLLRFHSSKFINLWTAALLLNKPKNCKLKSKDL